MIESMRSFGILTAFGTMIVARTRAVPLFWILLILPYASCWICTAPNRVAPTHANQDVRKRYERSHARSQRNRSYERQGTSRAYHPLFGVTESSRDGNQSLNASDSDESVPISAPHGTSPYDSNSATPTLFASSSQSRRSLLSTCATTVAGATLLSNEAVAAALETSTRFDTDEARRIAIFEKVSPSVVFVDTFTERRDSLTTNVMEVPLGSGSGIVWDRDGHVVTNFHVIRNAQSAQVAILLSGEDAVAASKVIANSDSKSSSAGTSDLTILPSSATSSNGLKSKTAANMVRRVFTARIVGVDPGKDIAVLKIDADPVFLFPIAVGTSQGIKVGQQAMAIGNPFGLDHTLTSGIISGTGREVRSPIGRPITDVLQTDAAINPGNSGGPLLDSSGKLIGMNTAIYSPSGASAGIGFAIPVDAVKVIVETLIRDGQVVRPILGISYLGSKQARTLGISTGVLVLDVPPDSPAAKAGLKGTRRTGSGLIELGDIIVQVGGQTIDVEADLFSALEDLKPGDTVAVTVNRIVAVNDELQMKEMVLQIVLQSSRQVEKNMLQLLYQVPSQ